VLATSAPSVNGDGIYQSTAVTENPVGTYQWVASYSGDANNAAIPGSCNTTGESVVVSAVTPTLTTHASGTVATGGVLSDTATLAGGASPTGTITFKLCMPNQPTCATPRSTVTTAVSGNGVYTSPQVMAGGQAGTYHWIASYGGDANNAAVSGHCGDSGESVVVFTAASMSTLASGPVVEGSPISDSATLAAGSNPTGRGLARIRCRARRGSMTSC
jgi:hypothetical protein